MTSLRWLYLRFWPLLTSVCVWALSFIFSSVLLLYDINLVYKIFLTDLIRWLLEKKILLIHIWKYEPFLDGMIDLVHFQNVSVVWYINHVIIPLDYYKLLSPFAIFWGWVTSNISWEIDHLYFLLQGNVVLCGLRNGAIVTVDIRERPEGVSNRLIKHQIPYSPLHRTGQNSKKQWFEVPNFFRRN